MLLVFVKSNNLLNVFQIVFEKGPIYFCSKTCSAILGVNGEFYGTYVKFFGLL
jgi:hypothetical protein